jgi:hypothetical protein
VPPRLLGSLVGGIIVLTNTRTLLRSDWVDAPDATRYAVYAVIYLLWAAAVAWSFREYRKDGARETADALAAEAALLAEQDRVAHPDEAAPESVRSGRPSAPPA